MQRKINAGLHRYFLALCIAPLSIQAADIRLELNILWQEPQIANGPIEELSEALSSTEDTWIVTIGLEDFLINSTPGEHFAAESEGLISMNIESTTPLPENIAPMTDHLSLFSSDFAVASRFNTEAEKFGLVRLDDNIRGAANFQPGWVWTFTRGLSQFLPEGSEISSETILTQLNNPGIGIRVEESFVKSQIANFFRYGDATIVSATLIDDNPAPATCRYEHVNEWPDGFHGAIYIKNESDEIINGWDLALKLGEGLNIIHSWGINLSGGSPSYHLSNVSWNQLIYPGQEINFGFIGEKASSSTPISTLITSDICEP